MCVYLCVCVYMCMCMFVCAKDVYVRKRVHSTYVCVCKYASQCVYKITTPPSSASSTALSDLYLKSETGIYTAHNASQWFILFKYVMDVTNPQTVSVSVHLMDKNLRGMYVCVYVCMCMCTYDKCM